MGVYGSPDTFPYDKMDRKCPKCGKLVTGRYCPECGARIDGKGGSKGTGCLIIIILAVVVFIAAVKTGKINMNGSAASNKAIEQGKITMEQNPQFTQVNIGDSVSSDTAEITLTNVSFSDQVKSDWAAVNQTYTPSDDNTCIRIDFDIKNTGNESLKCSNLIVCQVLYNSAYKYNGVISLKDSEKGFADFLKSEIMPLETKNVIILVPVPPEVRDGKEPLEVIFGQQSNLIKYVMR